MTITNQKVAEFYAGNGSSTNFAITQKFQSNTEIQVYLTTALNVTSLLVLNTHYTLTGGNPATTVVMVTAPAVGETLTIKRNTAKTQTADYQGNSRFPAETHEEALDKIVQMVQEVNYELSRTFKVPLSDEDGLNLELPLSADRANKYAAYDGDGKPIATVGPITPGSTTPYIDTLLDDTTAAQARTTLGFTGAGATASTANIEDNAVTNAKLRDSAAVSVIGRSANTSGDPADIAAASNDTVLKREGDVVGFGKVKNADIDDGSITASKLNVTSSATQIAFRHSWDYSGSITRIFPQFAWSNPLTISTINSIEANTAYGVCWSANGEFLFVANQTAANGISWYQKQGDNFYRLGNPATMPTGQAFGIACTQNAEFVAVAHQTSPFVTIYQRSGRTLTKLANPVALPTGNAEWVDFSPNGEFLAVAHATSPFITVYQRSGTTFTKINNPATLPSLNATTVAWSPDNELLFICAGTSNNFIYQKSLTYPGLVDTLTKLPDTIWSPSPSTVSAGAAAWSPNGRFLALGHVGSPFITIYERGANFSMTKLADPASLPTGLVEGLSWSSDSKHLACAHANTPFLTIYEVSGTTFTKLSNPATLMSGTGRSVAFSPTKEYLAMGGNGTPQLLIYKTSGNMVTTGICVIDRIEKTTI